MTINYPREGPLLIKRKDYFHSSLEAPVHVEVALLILSLWGESISTVQVGGLHSLLV